MGALEILFIIIIIILTTETILSLLQGHVHPQREFLV